LTASLAADRNIDYTRENRIRALMARSQGSRAISSYSADRPSNGRQYGCCVAKKKFELVGLLH
jgi:hypothetical protein